VFSALYNGPDSAIVKDAEGKVSGFWARYPMQPPEKIETKGGPCRHALGLLQEHDKIIRIRDLFEKELKQRYRLPEQPEGGEAAEGALMSLYGGMTVGGYLKKHPEDAREFGLVFRPDLTETDFEELSAIFGLSSNNDKEKDAIRARFGTFRTEDEKKILNKSLVQYLEERPAVGYRLGDKALAFRIQATGKNLQKIDQEYKKLLERLPELKKRKENGFPLWARAYHSVRHGLYRSLWWVRDNPILTTAIVSLLVLLKIGFALFLLEKIEFGHRESGHREKKLAPTPHLQPAQAYRSQPPPYAPQVWQPPYYSQQYAPQPYYSPQAPVYPAPYFAPTPTPLQTALSMPTT
jgi:hypothetical protein